MDAWQSVCLPNSAASSLDLITDEKALTTARLQLATIALPSVSSLARVPTDLILGLNQLQQVSVNRAVLFSQYSKLRESHISKKVLRKKLKQADQAVRKRLELLTDKLTTLVYLSHLNSLYRRWVLNEYINILHVCTFYYYTGGLSNGTPS